MADEEPQLRRLIVPEEANGQRLDLFLVQQLTEVSRSRVQLLLQQGSGSTASWPRRRASCAAEKIFRFWAIPNPLPCAPWRKRFRWRLFMKTKTLRS